MELTRLIEALSDPSAYPESDRVEAVEVHQTHLSVVFLAGPFAYKIKKPVALGFVDYGTLARRRAFCDREVALNRRLAAPVYRGVVAVTRGGAGVRMEGDGEVVEWAVKMERLPDEARLRDHIRLGAIDARAVEALARRIAEFHASAERGPSVSAFGRFAVVAGNARENFEQSARHVGTTLSRAVFERLRERTEQALEALRPTIEARAERGLPRDGHGDLRLDHVYLFPGRPAPDDLVVIDTIEFDDRFRCADPVADIAFLVMDLISEGRRDLAGAAADAYLAASGDLEGRLLLPFYTAYRAAVRGKVEGMQQEEPEVPEAGRAAALESARAHWLVALGELEEPARRPALALVGGLPGSGKSTLARGLAERAGFAIVRSDLVRKELAGPGAGRSAASGYEAGIYTPEWTERTYAECLRRAEALLFEGRRVVVDATFRDESARRLFLDAAVRSGVPARLLVCRADPEVVRRRLELRRDDASDADWSVYLRALGRWEGPSPRTRAVLHDVDTGADPERPLAHALELLRADGLAAGQGDGERSGGPSRG